MAKVLIISPLERSELGLLDRFQIEKREHVIVCESRKVPKTDFNRVPSVVYIARVRQFGVVIAIISNLLHHERLDIWLDCEKHQENKSE